MLEKPAFWLAETFSYIVAGTAIHEKRSEESMLEACACTSTVAWQNQAKERISGL